MKPNHKNTTKPNHDAFGRQRNPANWNDYTTIPSITLNGFVLDRGYTGHQHLKEFGIINMNGRLYDPIVGRMLNVDNFVQDPSSSQAFNRYSYVVNNPLEFTDPSGWLKLYDPDGMFSGYEQMNHIGTGGAPSGGGHWVQFTYQTTHAFDIQTQAKMIQQQGNELVDLGGPWVTEASLQFTLTHSSWTWVHDQPQSTNWNNYFPNNSVSFSTNGSSGSGSGGGSSGVGISVSHVTDWKSFIPVYGSGMNAIADFQEGNYGWAAFNTVMAISDIFLIKSLFNLGGKAVWKAGSNTWNANRPWAVKNGWAKPWQPIHHWAVNQASNIGKNYKWFINQPWNFKPISLSLYFRTGGTVNMLGTKPSLKYFAKAHNLIEGKAVDGLGWSLNYIERFYYGTTDWFKGLFGIGGDIINR